MFKKKALPEGDVAPAGDDAGGDAAPKGGSRRKIGMILRLVLLSVVALIGGLVAAIGPGSLMAMLGGDAPHEETATPQVDGENPIPPGADMVVMPFDEMIVNITATAASGRQTSRFLKLDLALVYDKTQDEGGMVEMRHVFLRDAFQDYLRQLAERDLDGTLGLVTVKGELLRRARAIAGNDAPHEVLIMGLVIQ